MDIENFPSQDDLQKSFDDLDFNMDDIFSQTTKICTVAKDPTRSGLEEMPDNAFVRYCNKKTKLIATLDDIGLPEQGQQIRIVTRRNFNAIEFIEYITEREKITDLKMTIYSINYFAAKILMQLIDSEKIVNTEILMSNLRNAAHREKEQLVKAMFLNHPRIKLFFCSSHAKTFSCKTEQGNYYTLEGSGNLAYNSRVEQYVIDNDKQMYDFTCQWMKDIKNFLSEKETSIA